MGFRKLEHFIWKGERSLCWGIHLNEAKGWGGLICDRGSGLKLILGLAPGSGSELKLIRG